jgi:mannose-6-phosphate isomerase-like protein (cupin superfamily)
VATIDYTIKNLRDLEDVAAGAGLSEHQEARFAYEELDLETMGVSLQLVKPGKRHAFAHRHEEAEEVYVVLLGTGRVKLDDEVVDLRPLDAIRVGPSVTRAFEAGPEGLELLVFGPRHKGDAEIVQDLSWETT